MVLQTRKIVEDFVLYKIHSMVTGAESQAIERALNVKSAVEPSNNELLLVIRQVGDEYESRYKQTFPDLMEQLRSVLSFVQFLCLCRVSISVIHSSVQMLRNVIFSFVDLQCSILTLWRLAKIGDFREKKHRNARGFAREFLWSGQRYRPGKRLKRCSKSITLHFQKNFAWGCRFFVSDVISGRLLGYFGPLYLAQGANR